MSIPEVKVGWLQRKSSILKRWKRSYFKLYADGNLTYFEDGLCEQRQGHFNLASNCKGLKTALECEVDPPGDLPYGCLLKIQAIDGDDMILSGSSTDEALCWKMMFEQLVGANLRNPNQRLPICVPRRRGYRCHQQPGYRVRSDVYYYPAHGPVQVQYDAYGRPYYVHPQQQVVTVIHQDDPYYYRNGDMVFGLAAGAMLGWAMWTPFLFF